MQIDTRQSTSVQRNMRLLEFVVIFLIVMICLWLITPGISDGIRFGHETTIKHSASALRDSLRMLHLQQQSAIGETFEAQKLLDKLVHQEQNLTREMCAQLWLQLLGDAAPSAQPTGNTVFRIHLIVDADQHLGCRFQYTLAGKLFIDYFPMTNSIVVDDVF